MFLDQETFLDVKDLTVEYSSGGEHVHAVNHVSFSLRRGKTLALVGETGAGKTTIAKSILRILPDPQAKIMSGSIVFDGQDLLNISENDMRRIRGKRISMVFQDPMTALNPVKTIGSQISEVIKMHEMVSHKEAAQKAREMLELVGIPGRRAEEFPHQFSGGMKQRAVISIALACQPDLLLLDEPTSALDVTIQAQVLDLIRDLKKSFNSSVILITHDLGVVAGQSDDVAIVYAGEIVEYGPKEEVFLHPSHPYTIGLFGAIPDIYSKAKRLTSIKGLPPDPTELPAGCCFSPRCPYATAACQNTKYPLSKVGPDHYCSCPFTNTGSAHKQAQ